MRLFSKKPTYIQHAPRWYEDSAMPRSRGTQVRRRPTTLPAGPRESLAAARQSVHQQADRSREEIKDLVEAERTEMLALVADSVKETEEKLRGATENRVDLELKRIREAEEKMRTEISDSVRAEVAKTISQLRSSRQRESNPAQAAKPKSKSTSSKARSGSRSKSKSRSNGSVKTAA